jgi:hydrogenase maturation protein HypF
VQHHLAHILACLLENGQPPQDVLGVAWDGTGFGEDGTIWGGEFITLTGGQASRFARFRPFRLPGADAAIRDGRRTALALSHAAGDLRFDRLAERFRFTPIAGPLRTMLDHGTGSPWTSSVGRLFDAAGAVLGLGGENHFEGQTALAVEAAATESADGADPLPFPIRRADQGGAIWEVDWSPAWDALLGRQIFGADPRGLARGFHLGLAQAVAAVAREAGASTVALSGGCFQNALLVDLTVAALTAAGFKTLVHRELPANDGNICAGQAAGALWGLGSVRLP